MSCSLTDTLKFIWQQLSGTLLIIRGGQKSEDIALTCWGYPWPTTSKAGCKWFPILSSILSTCNNCPPETIPLEWSIMYQFLLALLRNLPFLDYLQGSKGTIRHWDSEETQRGQLLSWPHTMFLEHGCLPWWYKFLQLSFCKKHGQQHTTVGQQGGKKKNCAHLLPSDHH